MLFQIVIELVDSDPVNSRTTLICLHPSQCFLQVLSFNSSPPSVDLFQLGFRVHTPPSTIRTLLPFPPSGASPVGEEEKSRLLWMFCQGMSLLRLSVSYFCLLLFVRAFSHRSRLSLSVDSAFRLWSASLASPTTWPTIPSADFCSAVRMPRGSLSRRGDTEQISRGKFNRLLRAVAGSTLRAYLMDMGFAVSCQFARPTLTPCIRFLSIDSRICSTLPSDPASRR